jgi:hypothetical protein
VTLTSYLLGNGTPELRGGADTTRLAENVSDAGGDGKSGVGRLAVGFSSYCRVVEATRQDPDSGSADLLVVGSRGIAGLLEP